MKRAHRVFFAGAAACVLVACNIIAGFESEYTVGSSGSSGGAEAGNPDGPNAEGSADSTVEDVQNDNALPDGRVPAFCENVDASTCIDFEDPTKVPPPNLGFNQLMIMSPDASIQVEPKGGNGGTAGLHVRMFEATASAATGNIAYAETVVAGGDPGAFTHYEVEFDFKRGDIATDYTALGILTFPDEPGDREHGIAAYPQNSLLSTLTPVGPTPVSDPTRTWWRASIKLTRTDASTTFDRMVKIGTTTVNTASGKPYPGTGGTVLRLGTFNTGINVGDLNVYFDNIVVRRW